MPDIIESYKTIASPSKGFYKDKNSKFHSFAFNVNNEQEIKEFHFKIKKEYHDAKHHCFAWCLNPDKSKCRVNDDGEPGNSAGTPILNQIYSYDLTNILIIVVRYFGGTKLGIPGLINAYKNSAADAINNSTIIVKRIVQTFNILFDYKNVNKIMRIIRDYNIEIYNQKFDNICEMNIGIEIKLIDSVISKFVLISGTTVEHLNID
ncbi:MAG: YigZ family protein [Bacteroidota bacterium]